MDITKSIVAMSTITGCSSEYRVNENFSWPWAQATTEQYSFDAVLETCLSIGVQLPAEAFCSAVPEGPEHIQTTDGTITAYPYTNCLQHYSEFQDFIVDYSARLNPTFTRVAATRPNISAFTVTYYNIADERSYHYSGYNYGIGFEDDDDNLLSCMASKIIEGCENNVSHYYKSILDYTEASERAYDLDVFHLESLGTKYLQVFVSSTACPGVNVIILDNSSSRFHDSRAYDEETNIGTGLAMLHATFGMQLEQLVDTANQ